MSGNSLGKMLSMTSFGESHGRAIGVVVDGMPGGLDFCLESLAKGLTRRAPGGPGTSARQEADLPLVLSGIFEGKTLGSPICIIVENTDQRSEDYQDLEDRPGHADRTTLLKYGIRDPRGGGRSSGRETIARVIAGYLAGLIIPKVSVECTILALGELSDLQQMEQYLVQLASQGESVGGVVGVTIRHLPAGLGEPAFDKLRADLAKGLLSIGGCVSFAYGPAENFWRLKGTELISNPANFSGMEGGISNGDDISLRLDFRAPSSVGKWAKKGRHDPCIIPRALPVIEGMIKFILADHYLRQRAYR